MVGADDEFHLALDRLKRAIGWGFFLALPTDNPVQDARSGALVTVVPRERTNVRPMNHLPMVGTVSRG